MKRLIFIFILFFTVCASYSQNVNYGITLGCNFSTIITDDPVGTINYKPGLEISGIFDYSINQNMGLRFSPGYADRGSKVDVVEPYGSDVMVFKQYYEYITLPLQFRYNLSPKFSILAGPEISYLIRSSVSSGEKEIENTSDAKNKVDLGVAISAIFKASEQIEIGGKFNRGFISPIGEYTSDDIKGNIAKYTLKNQGFSIFISYIF